MKGKYGRIYIKNLNFFALIQKMYIRYFKPTGRKYPYGR